MKTGVWGQCRSYDSEGFCLGVFFEAGNKPFLNLFTTPPPPKKPIKQTAWLCVCINDVTLDCQDLRFQMKVFLLLLS